MSNLEEKNLDCKKSKHKQYNDFLKSLNSCSRVKEIINQHHPAIPKKALATR
jgi:hypothetical protein